MCCPALPLRTCEHPQQAFHPHLPPPVVNLGIPALQVAAPATAAAAAAAAGLIAAIPIVPSAAAGAAWCQVELAGVDVAGGARGLVCQHEQDVAVGNAQPAAGEFRGIRLWLGLQAQAASLPAAPHYHPVFQPRIPFTQLPSRPPADGLVDAQGVAGVAVVEPVAGAAHNDGPGVGSRAACGAARHAQHRQQKVGRQQGSQLPAVRHGGGREGGAAAAAAAAPTPPPAVAAAGGAAPAAAVAAIPPCCNSSLPPRCLLLFPRQVLAPVAAAIARATDRGPIAMLVCAAAVHSRPLHRYTGRQRGILSEAAGRNLGGQSFPAGLAALLLLSLVCTNSESLEAHPRAMRTSATVLLDGQPRDLGAYDKDGAALIAKDLAVLLHSHFSTAATAGAGPPPQLPQLETGDAEQYMAREEWDALTACGSLDEALQQLVRTRLAEQVRQPLPEDRCVCDPVRRLRSVPALLSCHQVAFLAKLGLSCHALRPVLLLPRLCALQLYYEIYSDDEGMEEAAQQEEEEEGELVGASPARAPHREAAAAGVASAPHQPGSGSPAATGAAALALAGLKAGSSIKSGQEAGGSGSGIGSSEDDAAAPRLRPQQQQQQRRSCRLWFSQPSHGSAGPGWALILNQTAIATHSITLPGAHPGEGPRQTRKITLKNSCGCRPLNPAALWLRAALLPSSAPLAPPRTAPPAALASCVLPPAGDMAAELLGTDWVEAVRQRQGSTTLWEPAGKHSPPCNSRCTAILHPGVCVCAGSRLPVACRVPPFSGTCLQPYCL